MRTSIIILIALVAAVILFFLAWSRVPDMLANNLSKKLGVSVSIDAMHLRPSTIEVDKLSIGNPRGYSLPKAFSAEEIDLKAPVTRYLSNDIVVEEVVVNDIYLGIEFDSTSGTTGNWSTIFAQYQKNADLDDTDGKKVTIKRLVCKNIRSELLFKDQGNVKKLPTIKQIVLTNISTEGGFPTDQLMSSILGQLIKEVFIQQKLNSMIKGLLLDSPNNAVDKFLKPFKGIFNTVPLEKEHDQINA